MSGPISARSSGPPGCMLTATWNIVTETDGALKSSDSVQGTICLVLRKRLAAANARRMEIEAEIEAAVAEQLARLNALEDAWHARARAETLYTDGDLTLAAYAAALQVVTAYSTIDRQSLAAISTASLRRTSAPWCAT